MGGARSGSISGGADLRAEVNHACESFLCPSPLLPVCSRALAGGLALILINRLSLPRGFAHAAFPPSPGGTCSFRSALSSAIQLKHLE